MPCNVGQSHQVKHGSGQNVGGIPCWEKLQGINALPVPERRDNGLCIPAASSPQTRGTREAPSSWVSCQERLIGAAAPGGGGAGRWPCLPLTKSPSVESGAMLVSPQGSAFLKSTNCGARSLTFQVKFGSSIAFIQQTQLSLYSGHLLFLGNPASGRLGISVWNEPLCWHLGSFKIIQLRIWIQRKGPLAFPGMSRERLFKAHRLWGELLGGRGEPP